jgi:hypothetical protein
VAQVDSILQEAGVSEWVRTMGQSFFDPLPGGADLSILKSILNDWPDREAQLLSRSAETAHPSDRTMIMGGVSTDDGATSLRRWSYMETRTARSWSSESYPTKLGSQFRPPGSFRLSALPWSVGRCDSTAIPVQGRLWNDHKMGTSSISVKYGVSMYVSNNSELTDYVRMKRSVSSIENGNYELFEYSNWRLTLYTRYRTHDLHCIILVDDEDAFLTRDSRPMARQVPLPSNVGFT